MATEVDQMWERREMLPRIEPQCLGDVIEKCWNYEYEDVHALKVDVTRVLGGQGWDVEDDELKGFDGAALFKDDLKASYPDPMSLLR